MSRRERGQAWQWTGYTGSGGHNENGVRLGPRAIPRHEALQREQEDAEEAALAAEREESRMIDWPGGRRPGRSRAVPFNTRRGRLAPLQNWMPAVLGGAAVLLVVVAMVAVSQAIMR